MIQLPTKEEFKKHCREKWIAYIDKPDADQWFDTDECVDGYLEDAYEFAEDKVTNGGKNPSDFLSIATGIAISNLYMMF